MAFTSPMTAVTGATFTAAQFNTNVRDNLNAIWVGTTAGDLDYYTSSSAKARLALTAGGVLYGSTSSAPAWLAKPSVSSVLTNDSGGVPAWLAKTSIGGIHAAGTVEVTPAGQSFTGGSFSDITSCSLTLTLAAGTTYKVILIAVVTGYNDTVGDGFLVRGSVGGTADPTVAGSQQFNGGAVRNEALPYIYYVSGVASGSCVCKMQCYGPGGTTSYVQRARLIALAFSE